MEWVKFVLKGGLMARNELGTRWLRDYPGRE